MLELYASIDCLLHPGTVQHRVWGFINLLDGRDFKLRKTYILAKLMVGLYRELFTMFQMIQMDI